MEPSRGQEKLWVNTVFGLASSPSILLPLPGVLLTALILFLDSIALGHFPLLQSPGGSRAKPATNKRAKGPFHPDPLPVAQQAHPPSLEGQAGSTRLPQSLPVRPKGMPQCLCLEETA